MLPLLNHTILYNETKDDDTSREVKDNVWLLMSRLDLWMMAKVKKFENNSVKFHDGISRVRTFFLFFYLFVAFRFLITE